MNPPSDFGRDHCRDHQDGGDGNRIHPVCRVHNGCLDHHMIKRILIRSMLTITLPLIMVYVLVEETYQAFKSIWAGMRMEFHQYIRAMKKRDY